MIPGVSRMRPVVPDTVPVVPDAAGCARRVHDALKSRKAVASISIEIPLIFILAGAIPIRPDRARCDSEQLDGDCFFAVVVNIAEVNTYFFAGINNYRHSRIVSEIIPVECIK